MAKNRKLQVFVSSTFVDLKSERQAAVEAILLAGHIPAGMELFTAGDESQMNVIKQWIDESDAYLLILGGRYGSIDPNTGKSYTHLEYEYAVAQNKPHFALVIHDSAIDKRVREHGLPVVEQDNPSKLKEFRNLVLSKISQFWSDERDIKLSIVQKLSEFERRPDLVGWVPGSEVVDTKSLTDEIARLSRENADLRQISTTVGNSAESETISFDELYAIIKQIPIRESSRYIEDDITADDALYNLLKPMAEILGEYPISALHFIIAFADFFYDEGLVSRTKRDFIYPIEALAKIDLLKIEEKTTRSAIGMHYSCRCFLTDSGRRFLSRLRLYYSSFNFDAPCFKSEAIPFLRKALMNEEDESEANEEGSEMQKAS